MMQRTKVVAEDSREAMAQIAREFGEDAVILSARKVAGGIEMIAAHHGRESSAPPALGKTPFEMAMDKKKKTERFSQFLNDGVRPVGPIRPSSTPMKSSMTPDTDPRYSALEKSVNEIKAMLGSELMLGGLRSAGASPALLSIFLAQSGALETQNSDKRFSRFLANRLLHKKPPSLTAGPRVIVTVGPSGSGKTTMLAQLAARLRMALPDEKITFVNADCSKLGASEQLRAYGRILDVPVVDIEQTTELANVAKSAGRRLSMFVDMPSNPDECKNLLDILEQRSHQLAPLIKCGVVASNLSSEAIDHLLDRYPKLDALALTKLNESPMTLAALSKLSLRGAGIAYLATSSHLVRGIVEPDVTALENLIRGSISGSADETLN